MSKIHKKKILLLNFEFPPIGAGAGRVSYEIAKEMSDRYSIDVVTSHFDELKDYEVTDGLSIFRVKSLRKEKYKSRVLEHIFYLINAFRKIKSLVKKNKYDICHCHFALPTGILAYFLKKIYKIPYILTIHGSDIPGFNKNKFSLLHKITPFFLRKILNNSRYTVSASHYLADLAVSSIKPNRDIKVIRQGFDSNKFNPAKKDRIILFTGRLVKQKGISRVVKALRDIKSDYEFHIVGDGPWKKELKHELNQIKLKTVLHGWLNSDSEEYKNLLSRADIYITGTKNENFSVALQEAMASGCAIIAPNVGGNEELLGDSAILINNPTPENIKIELENLIENPDKKVDLQEKVKERIKEYSLNKTVGEYVQLFEKESIQKTKMIFILGTAHCGSTLLDLAIDTAPEVFSVGELSFYEIYRDRLPFLFYKGAFSYCTCGQEISQCSFWKKINNKNFHIYHELFEWNSSDKKRGNDNEISKKNNWSRFFNTLRMGFGYPRRSRHINFSYQSYPKSLRDRCLPLEADPKVKDDVSEFISEVLKNAKNIEPECKYVLDSSKALPRLMYYLTREDIDLNVIFLRREIPALAYAWSKSGRKKDGLVSHSYWHSMLTVFQALVGITVLRSMKKDLPWITIKYKDLCKNPSYAIKKINRKFNINIETNTKKLVDKINNSTHHNINGNGLRLRKVENIKYDDKWKSNLSFFEIYVGKFLDSIVSFFGVINR